MTLAKADTRHVDDGAAERVRHVLPRLPALDGLRAVALGAVLLFHMDYVWARGGHLGVTAFFTLSGFLITALLLLEHDATGRIDFIAFWGRRARRLVPAALVCLGLVVVYVAATADVSTDGLLGDAAAAVTWLANWRFVAEGEAYSDLFSAPSPFQHFWSLAIEEQFYLALPMVAALALRLRRRGRARRLPLAVTVAAAVAVSTAAAALLHEPGQPALRAYYGTDARIAEPLVGVLLALVLIGPAGLRRFSLAGRRVCDTAGVLSLAGLAVLASTLSTWDTRLYEGGFLLAAVFTAVVVTAATQRGGVVDRMLSAPILQGIGRISYGAYLFHWPVFLWMTEYRTGLSGSGLLLARVGVTLTLAGISYVFIELPIRERRLPVQIGALAWPTATAGLIAALVLVTTMPGLDGRGDQVASGVAGGSPSAPTPPDADGDAATADGASQGTPPSTSLPGASGGGDAPGEPGAPAGGDAATATTAPPPPPTPEPEPEVRVAVIGDSLGGNLARGFEIWAESTGQVVAADLTIGSCPIGRDGMRRFPNGHEWPIKPECSWWGERLSDQFEGLRAFGPDVVVVQDSFSELPDRKQDDWPSYSRPGEPVFDTWLIGEYDEFIDTLVGEGVTVVMTNAVCADFGRRAPWNSLDDADRRIRALNRQVYPVLGGKAEIADLNGRLCPDGEYTNSVEGYDNARPDGFHLTDEAAAALVERWLGPIAVGAAD